MFVMIPSRKTKDVCTKFSSGGGSVTVPEFIECLDECAMTLAFPVGNGTIYHIVATINADYIAAVGDYSTPPESIGNVVYVYNLFKNQWAGVPVDQLVVFRAKEDIEDLTKTLKEITI